MRFVAHSAEFPTTVKEVVTLLVKSRQSGSNAMGVRVTRGTASIFLAFNPRMQDRFSAHFRINQQSQS